MGLLASYEFRLYAPSLLVLALAIVLDVVRSILKGAAKDEAKIKLWYRSVRNGGRFRVLSPLTPREVMDPGQRASIPDFEPFEISTLGPRHWWEYQFIGTKLSIAGIGVIISTLGRSEVPQPSLGSLVILLMFGTVLAIGTNVQAGKMMRPTASMRKKMFSTLMCVLLGFALLISSLWVTGGIKL